MRVEVEFGSARTVSPFLVLALLIPFSVCVWLLHAACCVLHAFGLPCRAYRLPIREALHTFSACRDVEIFGLQAYRARLSRLSYICTNYSFAVLCGRWETYPREFAKCHRCRKAKYCGKECQSTAWSEDHRF